MALYQYVVIEYSMRIHVNTKKMIQQTCQPAFVEEFVLNSVLKTQNYNKVFKNQ